MPKYCRPSKQKPRVGGSCIACYETKDKGDMEEALFPLVFCFCGLFSWVCLLPARLPFQNYGMRLTGMFICEAELIKSGGLVIWRASREVKAKQLGSICIHLKHTLILKWSFSFRSKAACDLRSVCISLGPLPLHKGPTCAVTDMP